MDKEDEAARTIQKFYRKKRAERNFRTLVYFAVAKNKKPVISVFPELPSTTLNDTEILKKTSKVFYNSRISQKLSKCLTRGTVNANWELVLQIGCAKFNRKPRI
eukprot:Pgem_evm1s10137